MRFEMLLIVNPANNMPLVCSCGTDTGIQFRKVLKRFATSYRPITNFVRSGAGQVATGLHLISGSNVLRSRLLHRPHSHFVRCMGRMTPRMRTQNHIGHVPNETLLGTDQE